MHLAGKFQHGRRGSARAAVAGVTLVELMVTLTVVGVLATVALPSMASFIRVSQLRTAAAELAAVLVLARAEAVKRGSPVTVCKSADIDAAQPSCTTSGRASWRDGWIMFVDHNQDGLVGGSGALADQRLRVGSARTPDLRVDPDANFASFVSYLPTGESLGNGGAPAGSFRFCLDGRARTISVNTTGRVQLREGPC